MAFCNEQCHCGKDCVRQDDHGGDCACGNHRMKLPANAPVTDVRAMQDEAHVVIARLAGDVSGKLGHEEDISDEDVFLMEYQKRVYPRPSVTVDLVIFTVVDSDLKVLLIKRKGHPYQGHWALPGGFLDVGDAFRNQGEDLEAAAHRELEEETHLPKGSCYLEQLYTFGAAGRDPRTRVVGVAYYALVRPTLAPMVTAGSDAAELRWVSIQGLWDKGSFGEGTDVIKPLGETKVIGSLHNTNLAFDHREILLKAIERIRGKIDYAPIAFDLVGETFTVAELRAVYEAVKGSSYDAGNFRRRFQRMQEDGIIHEAMGYRATATKPATVYRFKPRAS